MIEIFKAIVGSQAYGTSIPTSDTDYKGIYVQPTRDLVGFNYNEQIESGKDDTSYEIRRFLQLAQSANPTVLELMYSPDDCIITNSSAYKFLKCHRHHFLTKQCANSFGGYAIAQIKKATALDKKINWEKSRVERKGPLDFCYTYSDGKSKELKRYLNDNEMQERFCGLVKLNHFRDCYALHYDYQADYQDRYPNEQTNRPIVPLGYRGIAGENSNEVKVSSVPKYSDPQTLLYFNKDGYSVHCKDYREYQEWLATRNVNRYVDTKKQKIDGKNMMHCRRLLDMAMEIATRGELIVRRENALDLLKIRRGEVTLQEIVERAEEDIKRLDELYATSSLPDSTPKEFVNDLLLNIRDITYETNHNTHSASNGVLSR